MAFSDAGFLGIVRVNICFLEVSEESHTDSNTEFELAMVHEPSVFELLRVQLYFGPFYGGDSGVVCFWRGLVAANCGFFFHLLSSLSYFCPCWILSGILFASQEKRKLVTLLFQCLWHVYFCHDSFALLLGVIERQYSRTSMARTSNVPITKTRLFKCIENFTSKKTENF